MMWIEKHRPRSIDDIVGQQHVLERVKAFLNDTMPNLLLYGPRGTGKTSLVFVIARALYGNFWRENLLYVECADFIEHRKAWLKDNEHFRMFYDEYRSAVEIFNRAIREYAGIPPMNADFRIVFLKNADFLPANIQQSLRRMIERYSGTCRFILSTTMPARIIPAIRSRCLPLHFKPLDKQVERVESSFLREVRGDDCGGACEGEDEAAAVVCDAGFVERSALQQLLIRIFRKEGFRVTEEALKAMEYHARRASGDAADACVAICIGEAASAFVSAADADIIDANAVNTVAEHIISRRIRDMLNASFASSAEAIRELIMHEDSADIIERMHGELRERVMTAKRGGEDERVMKAWMSAFMCISDTESDIREAFNGMIHIEHMLMRLSPMMRLLIGSEGASRCNESDAIRLSAGFL